MRLVFAFHHHGKKCTCPAGRIKRRERAGNACFPGDRKHVVCRLRQPRQRLMRSVFVRRRRINMSFPASLIHATARCTPTGLALAHISTARLWRRRRQSKRTLGRKRGHDEYCNEMRSDDRACVGPVYVSLRAGQRGRRRRRQRRGPWWRRQGNDAQRERRTRRGRRAGGPTGKNSTLHLKRHHKPKNHS